MLSRGRRIIMIRCAAPLCTYMLVADHYPSHDLVMPNRQLFEIHRSRISLHHAKVGYDYPTIRLPFIFSKLAGLSTHIYQTVHNGALAFLVVVSSAATEKGVDQSEDAVLNAKSPALTWRRSPVRIRPSPSFVGGSRPAALFLDFRVVDSVVYSKRTSVTQTLGTLPLDFEITNHVATLKPDQLV
jgi:hypothetical protein